jgi:hypothetical protein
LNVLSGNPKIKRCVQEDNQRSNHGIGRAASFIHSRGPRRGPPRKNAFRCFLQNDPTEVVEIHNYT